MNALTAKVPSIARHTLVRNVATGARPSFVPKMYYEKAGFKKTWLSDPSTYPLMTIMAGAGCIMVGMTINALVSYEDVRIDPRKRTQLMRDWGQDRDHQPLVGKIVWWNSWQKLAPEGMGVDHQKWLEGKKEYNKDNNKFKDAK